MTTAGRKKVDKNCEDCGVLLVNVDQTRKLCYACAKKRRRAYQIEHQAEHKEYQRQYQRKRSGKSKGKVTQVHIENPNKKYCKGCVYWGGYYENNYCCNYIFIEGHSRPCPPGKDCTEKIMGKRKRTMEFGENRG